MVKVGSSSLTTAAGGLDPGRLDALVDAVAARAAGRYAGGAGVLRRDRRRTGAAGAASPARATWPPSRPRRRSGSSCWPSATPASFARHGLRVGQVLLTSDDVVRRAHYRNAQRTFAKLLPFGVVPVVNENDTVATAEIRFGDNDRLAALVAHLVGADALVLLSDVDALYTGDPRLPESAAIREVADVGDLAAGIAIVGSSERCRYRRHGLQALGRDDRHRRRDPGAAGVGRRTPRAARRSVRRPVVPRSAPRSRRPTGAPAPGCSGCGMPPPGRVAHPGRGGGGGRRPTAQVAAAGRDHRRCSGDFESGDVVDLLGPDGFAVARGFVAHDAAELPGPHRPRLAELPAELRRRSSMPTTWSRCPPGRVKVRRRSACRRSSTMTSDLLDRTVDRVAARHVLDGRPAGPESLPPVLGAAAAVDQGRGPAGDGRRAAAPRPTSPGRQRAGRRRGRGGRDLRGRWWTGCG